MNQNTKMATSYSIAESKNHYPFVDGLRGIAILMVIMVHAFYLPDFPPPGHYNSESFYAFLTAGARGVSLFFILSAFTLYSSSLQRYSIDRYTKTSFYLRRAFRILPFWWLMVFFYAHVNGNTLKQIAASIFFYFGFVRFIPEYDFVPGGWSLFVEETFYIFLPLFFLRIKTLCDAFKFFVLCYFIKLVWGIIVIKFHISNNYDYAFLFPLNYWIFFSIGILLYFLRQKYSDILIIKNKSFLITLDVITFISIYEMIRGPLAAIPLTLLFLSAMLNTPIIGKTTRFSLLMRYGGYSYSIYLLHFYILDIALPFRNYFFEKTILSKAPQILKFIAYFPIILVLCFIAGAISFNLIEKPCVKLGKIIIKKITKN